MAFEWDNKVPGNYGALGGNNITIRGAEILDHLKSPKPSKNLTEASLKTLRLYRKCCRLIPFVLRIHEIQQRVKPVHAKFYLANFFREKAHLREPGVIDYYIARGYEKMFEAEQHHTYATFLYQFISPNNACPGDQGYSYLDEKRFGNKSKFLKEFYRGDRPSYQ